MILTPPMKTKAGLIMITKLARKYLYGTKVYSAKHSPYGRKLMDNHERPYKWNNHDSMQK
jgi:hypothetical protein